MAGIEYGFRQAVRDVVLSHLKDQEGLFEALAATITNELTPIIQPKVQHHFLVRLGVLVADEREQVDTLLNQLERALLTLKNEVHLATNFVQQEQDNFRLEVRVQENIEAVQAVRVLIARTRVKAADWEELNVQK